jgi:LytS/YehU family sensor histidine kinase
LAQAQLAALQMQLQPHFLFNALNGIAALMHSDLHAADRMLGDLSELLRMTLEAAEEPEVPLRRELAYLDRYLAIEQARYGHRLTVERAVDSDVLDAVVPTLILQPLVENAIKYAVEPVRAPGIVRVCAQRAGEALQLTIADSGSPRAADRPAPGHGIGLSNTRARLAQLYPKAHALTVEPGVPSGSLVRVTMPYRVEAQPHCRGTAT